MKNVIKFIFTVIFVAFYSCHSDDDDTTPIADPTFEINLQMERTNSDTNFTSTVKKSTMKSKSAGWQVNADGKTQLTREIMFDLELENGETVAAGFWFLKYETNQELLILKDENLSQSERNWDYASLEAEAENFYRGFDRARVYVNNNVTFHTQTSENFNIINVEKTMVNGAEKSLVTLKVNGEAYGWYDPKGKSQEVYKIANGTFSGVIE